MSLPEVTTSQLDGERPIAVIHVRGEIDLASGPAVREALVRASGGRGTGVLVDLSECLFIDSTGISLLLNASRRLLRGGGDLAVVCPNPTPLRVFQITGTGETLNVVETEEDALSLLRTPSPAA